MKGRFQLLVVPLPITTSTGKLNFNEAPVQSFTLDYFFVVERFYERETCPWNSVILLSQLVLLQKKLERQANDSSGDLH